MCSGVEDWIEGKGYSAWSLDVSKGAAHGETGRRGKKQQQPVNWITHVANNSKAKHARVESLKTNDQTR